MNVREVLEFAKKNKVQVVDLKFVDLIGTWQHFTIPLGELTEDLFKDGSGLDGSSIRGWKAINNSDMLVLPDPSTACMDPFCAVPTLSLIGNVVDPITRETYNRDPRFIAQKAEKYLQSTKEFIKEHFQQFLQKNQAGNIKNLEESDEDPGKGDFL